MKQHTPLLFAAACILLAACGSGGRSAKQEDSARQAAPPADSLTSATPAAAQPVPGEYIVTFSDAAMQRFSALQKSRFAKDEAAMHQFFAQAYTAEFKPLLQAGDSILLASQFGFLLKGSGGAAEKLRKHAAVYNVQQNMIVTVKLGEQAGGEVQPLAQVVPWGVKKVLISSREDGNFKKAWIVDTGVDPAQPDLNMKEARNYVPSETNTDLIGHGTHVAGTIGAKANQAGVVGVAPNAPIHSLKVFKNTSPKPTMDVGGAYIPALEYVFNNCSAGDVLNLSYSGSGEIARETALVKAIAGKNVKVIIASGNEAADVTAGSGYYPANINGNNIVTVAAYDASDRWFGQSNYGTSVDAAAPGVAVESLKPRSTAVVNMTGTSQAAPHIAGLYLLKSVLNTRGTVTGGDGRRYNMPRE